MFSLIKRYWFIMMASMLIATVDGQARVKQYTLLNNNYHKEQQHARQQIYQWLLELHQFNNIPNKKSVLKKKVFWLTGQLTGKPYASSGAMGEGLSCHKIWDKQRCHHIQEDPIVSVEKFDCFTLVQVVIALLHSNNINEFNQTLLKIAYWQTSDTKPNINFFNRNHFTSLQFNPKLQQLHFIDNSMDKLPLNFFTKEISALIDMPGWLAHMKNHSLSKIIRSYRASTANKMLRYFKHNYQKLAAFQLPQKISMHYIPMEQLITCDQQGCQANRQLLATIPTPALLEIVRDPRHWVTARQLVSKSMGSELLVSHVAILYRHTYGKDDFIYNHIACDVVNGHKRCSVTPVYCKQTTCSKMMMLHASDAFPKGYRLMATAGHYQCLPKKESNTFAPTCNRVYSLPLVDYLQSQFNHQYLYVNNPAIVGIHVEKLLP